MSGSVKLATIARKSSPSVSPTSVTLPSTSSGTAVTINTNRKSSSFTHTIKLTLGGETISTRTGVGAGGGRGLLQRPAGPHRLILRPGPVSRQHGHRPRRRAAVDRHAGMLRPVLFMAQKTEVSVPFVLSAAAAFPFAQNTVHSKNTAGLPACARMLRHADSDAFSEKLPMADCPSLKTPTVMAVAADFDRIPFSRRLPFAPYFPDISI